MGIGNAKGLSGRQKKKLRREIGYIKPAKPPTTASQKKARARSAANSRLAFEKMSSQVVEMVVKGAPNIEALSNTPVLQEIASTVAKAAKNTEATYNAPAIQKIASRFVEVAPKLEEINANAQKVIQRALPPKFDGTKEPDANDEQDTVK